MLFFPLYCPACGNLSFFSRENKENGLVDITSKGVLYHTCRMYYNKPMLSYQHIKNLQELSQTNPEYIPFKIREGSRSNSETMPVGVLLSKPTGETTHLDVVLIDNHMYKIHMTPEALGLSAGSLLDLSKLARRGANEYRFKQVKLYPSEWAWSKPVPNFTSFLSLLLYSKNGEVLERYCIEVLSHFREQSMRYLGVIPTSIQYKEKDSTIYGRRILVEATELHQRNYLANLALPSSITVEIHQ